MASMGAMRFLYTANLDCHKQYDHVTMIDTEAGEIKTRRLAHIKEEFKAFIGDRALYLTRGRAEFKLFRVS